jgi:DNA-binding transcriptional ArsR family regulator
VHTYYDIQLDALGDATRRAIIDRLRRGPLPVQQLADGFAVSRPAISQHLRVLKEARLVTDHADGTRRIYAIDPSGFESLRDYLDQFWSDALSAFRRAAEKRPSRRKR